MQPGDVIRKFDGHDVRSFAELRSLVSQMELNKKIDLEMQRDGKTMKVATEIKEQPIDYLSARANPRPSQPGQQPQTAADRRSSKQPDEEDLQDEAPLAGVQVGN